MLAGHAFLRVFVWPFLLGIHSLGFTPYGFSGFGQRFVPSALLGFSSSAKGSWIHTLQGLRLWQKVARTAPFLRFTARLRPKVRAGCVPWGLGLRPKVPGFTLHSLGSSSSGKGGPDRPEQSGAEKHFLLDSILRVWENNTTQDNRYPGQARTKVRARINPRLQQSLLTVYSLGFSFSAQGWCWLGMQTFPAGFTPENLGKGGPDRPGQRFVLESIPVFNNHSLGFTP